MFTDKEFVSRLPREKEDNNSTLLVCLSPGSEAQRDIGCWDN